MEEWPVYLVTVNGNVVFGGHFDDLFQSTPGDDGSRWVVGIIDDNELGVWPDEAFQLIDFGHPRIFGSRMPEIHFCSELLRNFIEGLI
jgi:hypothetical protein